MVAGSPSLLLMIGSRRNEKKSPQPVASGALNVLVDECVVFDGEDAAFGFC